jgi:hypothetical protein
MHSDSDFEQNFAVSRKIGRLPIPEKLEKPSFLDLRAFAGFCGRFAGFCGMFAGRFGRAFLDLIVNPI